MNLAEGGRCLDAGDERHGMDGRLQAGVPRSRIPCREASHLVTCGELGAGRGRDLQRTRAATISSGPTGCRALAGTTQ
jgi:hypothetical protein